MMTIPRAKGAQRSEEYLSKRNRPMTKPIDGKPVVSGGGCSPRRRKKNDDGGFLSDDSFYRGRRERGSDLGPAHQRQLANSSPELLDCSTRQVADRWAAVGILMLAQVRFTTGRTVHSPKH
jgi:hypothetical protein